jgi:vancomycin resistance protein YoaR
VILSGQVARNVEVAGQSVGGVDESSLPDMVAEVGSDLAERPVTIRVPGEGDGGRSAGAPAQSYEATAQALGLTLDEQATADAALDAGREAPLPLRPFEWAASFFSTNDVPLRYEMAESQTAATLQLLQGEQLTQPTEPTIQLGEGGFEVVPGQPGTGLNPTTISDALLAAAEEDPEGEITIDGEMSDIDPYFSQEDAQALADSANEMTAESLTLKAGDFTTEVTTEQLRSWITPTETDEGGERQLELAFNAEAAQAAIPELFAGLNAEPTNATVQLRGSTPTVVPGANGVRCQCDEAGAAMWEALQGGQAEVTFEAEVVEPEHTTEEVEGWGIREPVGGSRAHQNGADIGGPAPGYTTYHDCCASRVTNIQRIADMVDGAVIPPGESFSINEHVGERTAANGFVLAGAIRDGLHVDEIGGGVSQFFTTTFNAAFFAGLDIDEYQAHTENFPRYPDGREATGGYPNPDLVITNNTPYGVLIDTSHTGTSVTVTLWSTPYATAEQSGISSSPNGACTNVTTTRTRRYPDGTTDEDSFSATYRPGEGQFCR